MLPIQRNEVLSLGEYEKIRPRFRARVIEAKRPRRFVLGPHIFGEFENRDTVLLQIQEMLRTERITQEAGILHEIATYNDLIPGPSELSLTCFVGIEDRELREQTLRKLAGLEACFGMEINGQFYPAKQDREEHVLKDRTTAVHYLKVPVDAAAIAHLRRGSGPTAVVVRHAAYEARADLGPAALAELAGDLGPSMGTPEGPVRNPASAASPVAASAQVAVTHRAVRFEEVDAAQIVFFARFFSYAHEAMEQFFGALAGGYSHLIGERRIGMPAVHVESQFFSPLRYGEHMRIETSVARLGRRSAVLRYQIFNEGRAPNDSDARKVLSAEIRHTVVVSDMVQMKSREMPEDVRALFERHLIPTAPSA